MSCWQRGHGAVSGKKRITVDEDAWREAMRKANRLRDVERELPGMIAAVQQAQEQQAARDRAAMQARQDELTKRLASLSEQARQLEKSTTRRINAADRDDHERGPEGQRAARVRTTPAARPAGAAVRRRAEHRAHRARSARSASCAPKWSGTARPGPTCSTRRGRR